MSGRLSQLRRALPSARICEPVRPGRGLALPPRMPRGCRSPRGPPGSPWPPDSYCAVLVSVASPKVSGRPGCLWPRWWCVGSCLPVSPFPLGVLPERGEVGFSGTCHAWPDPHYLVRWQGSSFSLAHSDCLSWGAAPPSLTDALRRRFPSRQLGTFGTFRSKCPAVLVACWLPMNNVSPSLAWLSRGQRG